MRECVIIVTALAFAFTPAMAGGKGGGGGHSSTNQGRPQESISPNYGKIQQTYTKQKPVSTGQAIGTLAVRPTNLNKAQIQARDAIKNSQK